MRCVSEVQNGGVTLYVLRCYTRGIALLLTIRFKRPHHYLAVRFRYFKVMSTLFLRHPLFPLLALLFEKCELATRTCGAEPSASELKRDLEAFAENTKCWSGGESVIDQLMIDALQVKSPAITPVPRISHIYRVFYWLK